MTPWIEIEPAPAPAAFVDGAALARQLAAALLQSSTMAGSIAEGSDVSGG